jgi:putative transposase
MAEYQNIRTGRHCAFILHAHLVFVTKYRHKVFTDAHLKRMEEIMRSVCEDFEVELKEFNGENNHVHLLVSFPPRVALSKLVNSLKGVSSRRLRQEYPELVRHYWRAQRLWSGSYFAAPSEAPHCRSSSSTSSSRTARNELRSTVQTRAPVQVRAG